MRAIRCSLLALPVTVACAAKSPRGHGEHEGLGGACLPAASEDPPARLAWTRVFRAKESMPVGRFSMASAKVDAAGVTTVLGVINGDLRIDLGGGELAGDRDRATLLLAKFAPSGAHLASRVIGHAGYFTNGNFAGTDYVPLPDGGVVLATAFGKDADVGGVAMHAEEMAVALARFDASLLPVWAKKLGGDAALGRPHLGLDAEGAIVFAGQNASSGVDMGGGGLAGAGIVLAR